MAKTHISVPATSGSGSNASAQQSSNNGSGAANSNGNFRQLIPAGYNTNVQTSQYIPANVLPPQEKVNEIMKSAKVSSKTAQNISDSIDGYTSWASEDMRDYQKGVYKGNDPDIKKFVKGCENYIKKAPKYQGETYRGINVSKAVAQQYIDSYNNGTNINMKGLSSWSTSETRAKNFSNGSRERLVFSCKSGQPVGTSISHLSEAPYEQEVLCSSKARWKITSYVNKGGIHYFEVEPVK